MRIIDITKPMNEKMDIYEGDPRFFMQPVRVIDDDGFAVCKLSMGTHTGTHVDGPAHFFPEGRLLDEIPLRYFYGRCLVTDTLDEIPGFKRVLLRASVGSLNRQRAEWIVENGIHLIGSERLSVGDDAAHKILLSNGCVILECLMMKNAPNGVYTLSALPLKISADGSPVRACLVEDDGEDDD